jgi:hypothetical protein
MKTIIRFLIVSSLVITQISMAQWVQTGPFDEPVRRLVASGTNLFAGTYPGGLFLSTDNGTSWTQDNAPLGEDSLGFGEVTALLVSGTNLFAASFNDNVIEHVPSNNGVFRSTDNGTTWTAANTGLCLNVRALAVSGTNLFAGGSGVFLSTNNGTSWTEVVDTNYTYKYLVSAFAVSPNGVGGTNLFAGLTPPRPNYPISSNLFARPNRMGGPSGVFLSTNNGSSWTEASNGLPTQVLAGRACIKTLIVSGTNLFASTYKYRGDWGEYGSGVFLSTNNGTNWTAVNNGLPKLPEDTTLYATIINSFAVSGTNLFAGTDSDGVFLSTNNGTSWTLVNNGLPKNSYDTTTYASVNTLAVSGTNLFAGTDKGVWRRPLSEMILNVEQSSSLLPDRFSLSQNYPNPFNPSTTLRYDVPERSNVRLSIFNTLGQKISEIVNETKDAGYYEHSFNASQLSSGIYFYRIEAVSEQNSGKTFVSTKKMVLMK